MREVKKCGVKRQRREASEAKKDLSVWSEKEWGCFPDVKSEAEQDVERGAQKEMRCEKAKEVLKGENGLDGLSEAEQNTEMRCEKAEKVMEKGDKGR